MAESLMEKLDLREMDVRELEEFALSLGEPRYRGRQLARWLFEKGATSFDSMTDLPLASRTALTECCRIGSLTLLGMKRAGDGAVKYLFGLEDGERVESVYIPSESRHTLCLSTQVGCRMGCRFCLTGRLGLRRQLKASEMVGQLLAVRELLPAEERLTNLVLMGMGEPLDNFEATVKALKIITSTWGCAFSPRRVTLSTCGLLPELVDFQKALPGVKLGISLNAPRDELRSWLMPVNRRHPLKALIGACRSLALKPSRMLTFEYVLLRGVNDSQREARELARLLRGLRAKVNLIPFNPFRGAPFSPPSAGAAEAFRESLCDAGFTAILRESRGAEVGAACGQLGGEGEGYCGANSGSGSFPPKREPVGLDNRAVIK
ncbi:MAG: 23S rRNA (adenine(2503)-C(2))-methyltransferase RlmN [Nitrospinota bacterium]